MTFTVSGAATNCTTATGPINGNNTALYNCVIATPVTGTYTVTAAYNGDANYSALAATAPTSLIVAKATPTITVTTSPASPVFGGTITYTATVNGIVGATAPAGSIVWGVTGAASACATSTGPIAGLSANQTVYTCTVAAKPAGSYNATATYSGDGNYTPLAATAPVTVTIAQVAPTIAMTGNGNGVLNSTLTFTTTVTGTSGATAPTGNVSWTITGTSGITSCTSTPASSSVGSITTYICTITASNYGSYVATAHYAGDINYLAGTSNSVMLGISNLAPTISVTASANPILGGTTTLTALVAGPAGKPVPAGSMAWTVSNSSGTAIACSTIAPTVNTSNYSLPTTAYSCTFPTAIAGTYTAQANFPGDSNYNSINSSIINISVTKADPTLSVTGVQSVTTSGQITTFTATITGVSGSLAPIGSPTWIITGASTSCSSTTGPVNSAVSSIYTCVVPTNVSGGYSAAISYAGDANYNAAGPSATYGINIAKVTPTIFVTTSSPTAALGSTFTFSATVTGPPGGQTPTGTGTWSITGVSGITCSSTTGPTGSSTSVIYTCSVNATLAGVYLPLFTYGGDSNYLGTSPTSGSQPL